MKERSVNKHWCAGVFAAAALMLLSGATVASAAAGLGEECGGFAVIKCEKGLWCEPEPGCGMADASGVCVAIPDTCAASSEPVCGCDGYTYANDCERRTGQVEKMADGACPAGTHKSPCNSVVDHVCGTTNGERRNYTNECWAKLSGATSITKGLCDQR